MTDGYQLGAWAPIDTQHVLIYEQARPSADDLKMVKAKATLAGLLGVEAGRRADQLAAQLDLVAARVTDLEHPPTPDPEPKQPGPVEVSDRPRAIATDDADWIVSGWRDDGWRS